MPPGRHVVGTLDLRRAIPRLGRPQLLQAAASAQGRHPSRHGRDVDVRHLLSLGASRRRNVYLHYVCDQWVHQWRQRHARGDVVVVRFADDFVVGFQHRGDAERFWADLRERFARFGLELHEGKTRLIEFGRFKLKRVTSKEKMRARLHSVKAEMRQRMHLPIPEQGEWLARVLRGHYNYYAVPDNYRAIRAFHLWVKRHWLRALRRRSQRNRMTWERMGRLDERWLPRPRIQHPWPGVRFDARTQGRSPVR